MELRMSQKERDRLKVVKDVVEGRMRPKDAARVWAVSEKQVSRVVKRYQEEGDAGLVHRLRGRPSNRKTSEDIKEEVIERMKNRYKGFGPKLASEKLEEELGLVVSRETVRTWMMEAKLSQPWKQRLKHHAWRERRECFGELVQMDTSLHDWFEGRGEKAVLITMIDDATSRSIKRFYPADGTESNMALLRLYLERLGRPVAIYADKAGHFKVNRRTTIEEDLAGREPETQIGRALRELGIEYIAAHSPQAKGRVERSFGTDQDRLVKGMRLAEIATIEAANRYLEDNYLPEWEKRFTVPATQPADVHRPLADLDLAAILSVQETRTVANDYTLRYNSGHYQIEKSDIGSGMRGNKVLIERRLDGSLHMRWQGRYLKYHRIGEPSIEE